MLNLTTDVRFIRGVGEARAKILENRGILTAEDLLYYLPYRYEDRTKLRGPDDVRAGEQATVIAPVLRVGMLSARRGGAKILRVELGDTKHWLNCKWFHGEYLERIIKPGQIICETDELGYHITRDPIHVHDLQATILHCLGIDHERLTFRHQGRDFRLTDVGGKVVREIIT